MEVRALTQPEQKYTYSQSTQIAGQTGCIGHLRGDFDSSGNGFYTTWDDHWDKWKTDEFKAELDEVIRTLEEGQYKELKAKKELLEKRKEELERAQKENRRQMDEMIRQHEKISGVNEQRGIQLEELLNGYVSNAELESQVHEQMKNASGQSVKNKQRQKLVSLQGADGTGGMQQACVESLQAARYKYLKEFPSGQFSGVEKSNEAYEALLDKYESNGQKKCMGRVCL